MEDETTAPTAPNLSIQYRLDNYLTKVVKELEFKHFTFKENIAKQRARERAALFAQEAEEEEEERPNVIKISRKRLRDSKIASHKEAYYDFLLETNPTYLRYLLKEEERISLFNQAKNG